MSMKMNVWNSKPVKYTGDLGYDDFVVDRKDARVIRFDNPINEGKDVGWAYKNLVTKDMGSNTYLAWIHFEPGGGHDYHAHSGWEAIYMLGGSLQFVYRSTEERDVKSMLRKGDVAVVPEGTPHSFWNTTEESCNFLVVKTPPYYLEELPLDPNLREIRLYKIDRSETSLRPT